MKTIIFKISLIAFVFLITGCGSSKSVKSAEYEYYTQEEYKQNKQEIMTYINYVNKLDLKPKVNSELPFPLNERYINIIRNKAAYHERKELNSEEIFKQYKMNDYVNRRSKSKLLSLAEYLNGYTFVRLKEDQEMKFDNIKVEGYNLAFISLKNLDTENKVNIERMYSTFFTEPVIFKNKDILVEVIHDYQTLEFSNGNFYIRITNLTNKFIDISTISLYLDSKINSMNVSKNLPPKGVTNYMSLAVPNYEIYKQVKSLNDTRIVASAVQYKLDQKDESLFEEKVLKFK